VLIDAENAPLWSVGLVLADVARYGKAQVKRAYGDWLVLASWKKALLDLSIRPVQVFGAVKGKNAADLVLVIDAMDLLHSGAVDGFALVSSDSDFTRLAERIREAGLTVHGHGEETKTKTNLPAACDTFVFVETLAATAPQKPAATPDQTRVAPRAATSTPASLGAASDSATSAPAYFESRANLDASSPEVYDLLEFTVNGQLRPVRRIKPSGAQSSPSPSQTLATRRGKRSRSPTHPRARPAAWSSVPPGLRSPVQGRRGEPRLRGLRHPLHERARLHPGAESTRVVRSLDDAPSPAAEARYDGWAFPRSSVAFCWVLDAELARTRHAG
jgi:hypothetical protein